MSCPCFQSTDGDEAIRVVYSNNTGCNEERQFPDNKITNTKYTIYNFLPKNLLAQCSQHMNRYFLLIAFLQLWSEITPVNPITTWAPLIIIFAISAVKEAVDDYGRYQSDCLANQRLCCKLDRTGREHVVTSEEILVGDIVYIKEDEEIPADCVVLTSSNHGQCYIETANIDGETNLKSRSSLLQSSSLSIPEICNTELKVECAPPDNRIYHFDSTLSLENRNYPLSTENLLLQATYLRNTEWVVGLVVYTGSQTKMGQNKTVPRQKWTRLDHAINRVTIFVFTMQLCFIIALGIIGNMWKTSKGETMWYLYYLEGSWYTPFIIPLRFMLLASMMIPISLKVSLDLAKLFYSLLINWDLEMYDSERDEPAHASNTAIAEDLGQIQYILTDKTGTLTENNMVLCKFAVGTRLFPEYKGDQRNPLLLPEIASEKEQSLYSNASLQCSIRDRDPSVLQLLRSMAICNTVIPSKEKRQRELQQSSNLSYSEQSMQNLVGDEQRASSRSRGSRNSSYGRESEIEMGSSKPSSRTVHDENSDRDDLLFGHQNVSSSSLSVHSPPQVPDISAEDTDVSYVASSPDEECLVKAACRLKVALTSRVQQLEAKTDTVIDRATINVAGVEENYEILGVLAFTSARKRMSIVARNVDTGSLQVFIKGADEVILPRILSDKKGSETQHDANISFARKVLDCYAERGLRTLCFAWKEINEEQYQSWRKSWDKAALSVSDREAQVAMVADTMENDFHLVGITGIEDALQPLVPETIETMRRAGIKIWMLTGDKLQTAMEISRACRFIQPSDQVFTVTGHTPEDIKCSLFHIKESLACLGSRVKYAIVVEGSMLVTCLARYKEIFVGVMLGATAVVCCRVTPSQKASVVSLVKDAGFVTLAIGDGGNDVSMIQVADIGVGLSGREGLQAARAADFSLARFSFLKRLILVHGRYAYNRTAFISQYCFYKSLFICLIQLAFSLETGFSGSSLFSSFSLTMYNIFYTSLPVMLYCLEKDAKENLLLAAPVMYMTSCNGSRFTLKSLLSWLLTAFYHAFVVVIVVWNTSHGKDAALAFGDSGHTSTALVAYTCVVLLQTWVIVLETTYFTILNHIAIWGTLLLFFALNMLIAVIPGIRLSGIFLVLMGDKMFWLRVVLCEWICVMPLLVIKSYQHRLWAKATNSMTPKDRSYTPQSDDGLIANDHLPSISAAMSAVPVTTGLTSSADSKDSFLAGDHESHQSFSSSFRSNHLARLTGMKSRSNSRTNSPAYSNKPSPSSSGDRLNLGLSGTSQSSHSVGHNSYNATVRFSSRSLTGSVNAGLQIDTRSFADSDQIRSPDSSPPESPAAKDVALGQSLINNAESQLDDASLSPSSAFQFMRSKYPAP